MSTFVINCLKDGVTTHAMTKFVNMLEINAIVCAIQDCEEVDVFKPTAYGRLGSYSNADCCNAIKKMLQVVDQVQGNRAKSIAASIVMRCIFDNLTFVLDHSKLRDRVYAKLEEFQNESSNGITVWATQLRSLLKTFINERKLPVEGFKGFKHEDGRLVCRGLVYTIGQTMHHTGPVNPRSSGLHFSKELEQVFEFYPYTDPSTVRYCRVVAPRDATTLHESDVSTTNRLFIKEYMNGMHTRNNGNRIEFTDGCVTYIKTNDKEAWYNNTGYLHRTDGPALITRQCSSWYVNGKSLGSDISDAPSLVLKDGTKIWLKDELIHRRDGPAVVSQHYKMWFLRGKRHRLEGPAYIGDDGSELWFNDNKLHREYGPAVVWRGRELYCMFGQFYREGRTDTAVVNGAVKEWQGAVEFTFPFDLELTSNYLDLAEKYYRLTYEFGKTDDELNRIEQEIDSSQY